MLSEVHPILPMRDKTVTKEFYVSCLGFKAFDEEDKYERYLMIRKDGVELHFSLEVNLQPENNDSSCYIRTNNIEDWYQVARQRGLDIAKELQTYPWGQREFVLRDPNHNSIVFGESV